MGSWNAEVGKDERAQSSRLKAQSSRLKAESRRLVVMSDSYHLKPVGIIRKTDDKNWIEVFDKFSDALLGLDGFSHIYVFYWFDQNDSPEKRKTLQVHPRKDPALDTGKVIDVRQLVRRKEFALDPFTGSQRRVGTELDFAVNERLHCLWVHDHHQDA